MNDLYIPTAEAAKLLNVSLQQIRNLLNSKKLDGYKVGRNWVVSRNSVFNRAKGQLNMPNSHNNKMASLNSTPIALSFFSGAMGMDIGLEKAGFETLLTCEIESVIRDTISRNKPGIPIIGDIRQYSAKEVLDIAGVDVSTDVDLIVGGPPCQAFSTAGRRQGFNDDRGNVFLTYLELATTIRPKYIVIENVRGLMSCPIKHRPHCRRGESFDTLQTDELTGGALLHIIKIMEDNGYSVSFNLYNAANFGTPQKRERIIIVCNRSDIKVPHLKPTHSEDEKWGLKPWETFRMAVDGLTDHHHVNFPESRLKYYRLLKEGQNWRNLPKELQQEAMGNSYFAGGGKTGFYRRLAWDAPSPTVVTHPAMPATDLCHPAEDRPLSVEEYKRVQEFPDNWEITGSITDQYKQIGNAVPVSLGVAVGKCLTSHMQGICDLSPNGFRFSRYRNCDEISWVKDMQQANAELFENVPEQKPLFSSDFVA